MTNRVLIWIPAAVLGALLAFNLAPQGAVAADADNSKVRVVDLDAIIQKSSKAKAIMGDFKKYQEGKRAELKSKEREVQKMQKGLDRNSPPEKLNAYGQKVQEISQLAQQAELDIQQQFMKTRSKLLNALRPTLQAYAKDKGIGLLLDKNTGGVVYADKGLDTTDDIKARTN